MICSKLHAKESKQLSQVISDLAKHLCTEAVAPEQLQELVAGRLIPLDKNPGIRPIGIGEVLRRNIAKAVTIHLRENIQLAGGSLQTCSGIPSGIEAAVHSMKKIYSKLTAQKECSS